MGENFPAVYAPNKPSQGASGVSPTSHTKRYAQVMVAQRCEQTRRMLVGLFETEVNRQSCAKPVPLLCKQCLNDKAVPLLYEQCLR